MAVLGVERIMHFINWPNFPAIFGSQEAATPELKPSLVMPTVPVKHDQIQNNNYPVDYSSPLTCSTFLGKCVPDTYSKERIQETGTVPVYAKDVIQPKDIGIVIDQASADKPGLVTYSLHVATLVLGKATPDENTISIEEYVDLSGHTTPIPTGKEIRQTGLEMTVKAAADTTAIPGAEAIATQTLTDRVSGIAQGLLDGLSKKGLLAGTYTIKVNVY